MKNKLVLSVLALSLLAGNGCTIKFGGSHPNEVKKQNITETTQYTDSEKA